MGVLHSSTLTISYGGNMNRKIVILVLVLLNSMLFVSCAKANEHSTSSWSVENEISYKAEKEIVDDDAVEKTKQEEEKSTDYIIPGEENIVYYEGTPFVKSVYGTGQDLIYIIGRREDMSFFLGCMEADSKELEVLDTEIPEDMRAFEMYVDSKGLAHILWMSVENEVMDGDIVSTLTYEKSYIWVVDREGKIQKEVDVSKIIGTECGRPFCFVVDEDGNYYWEDRDEILKIKQTGELHTTIACEGNVIGIGLGKSGELYCTYRDKEFVERLGRVEQDTFIGSNIILPEADAGYSYLTAGIDSELILYNKASGVYSYDVNENKLENRISVDNIPVDGQSVNGYGLLQDARICLMTQENNETIFYYVPVL